MALNPAGAAFVAGLGYLSEEVHEGRSLMDRFCNLCGLAVAWILCAIPPVMAAQDADLYEAAKKNNETEITWYQSHIRTESAEKIGQAFSAKYPGIKVNVFNGTAAVMYQRVVQDFKAGTPQADLFGTTNAIHMPQLIKEQRLDPHIPENLSLQVPNVRSLNEPSGLYTITYASVTALTYNSDKVKSADIPKNWTDLLDKKWQGQVTVGSPNFSGTLAGWVVLMKNLYGMEFFQRLADNKPLVGRSIDDALVNLNSGERSIAAGDAASTSRNKARGNPVAVSYPSDGAMLLIGPTAVLKGAKHPNAAKLFINYLLTGEAAKVIVAEYEQSVSVDAPLPPSGPALKDIKTAIVPLEDTLRDLAMIQEKWKELFGN
jgi:iron(III) transport system substrate-binding protein